MVTSPAFEMHLFFSPEGAVATIGVAISSCLSGAAVRYDGQSKPLATLQDWTRHSNIRLLPICPEVEAGLPVARPPVQLGRSNNHETAQLLALGRDDATLNVTAILQNHAQQSAERLRNPPSLCGYIWKSRSPSCGLGSTPIFDSNGTQIGTGSGIEAYHLQSALPWLAHAEESALDTPIALRSFELRCRLVCDGRTAQVRGTTLAHWHAHYAFLRAAMAVADVGALEQLCAEGLGADEHWQDYLTALQQACRKIKAEQLLGLFID